MQRVCGITLVTPRFAFEIYLFVAQVVQHRLPLASRW